LQNGDLHCGRCKRHYKKGSFALCPAARHSDGAHLHQAREARTKKALLIQTDLPLL
jgi:hypothetical protein